MKDSIVDIKEHLGLLYVLEKKNFLTPKVSNLTTNIDSPEQNPGTVVAHPACMTPTTYSKVAERSEASAAS